jgi:plastocyanin
LKRPASIAIALVAAVLAACAGHSGSNAGSNGGVVNLPGLPGMSITAKLPSGSNTIIEELPSEGIGTVHDRHWHSTFGHFSQQQFSQALGFPPGTQITVQNVSLTEEHTLNVVGVIDGPPARFPRHPKLSLSPSGGNLKKGYASGPIPVGGSITVKLEKPGIYLIGCAYHYEQGMKDVLVVSANATPGPQGTPPPQ